MNFMKRAFLSVKARKGKTLLQILIFTAVCILVISGLAIQNAADKAADLARQSLGGDVTLQLDMERMMERAQAEGGLTNITREPVLLDDVAELASYSYVKGYNLLSSTFGTADDFSPVEAEESESGGNMMIRGAGMDGDLNLQGILYSESAQAFADTDSTLIEGRHITEEDVNTNVALIEKTLAEENDLSVGDKITISEMEFEVVGIYEATVSSQDLSIPIASMLPFNRIFIPYTAANEVKGEDAVGTVDSATFFMDDPANVDSFISQAKEESNVDFETYALDANNSLYQQMTGPINNVASFSNNIVYLVTIAGTVILGLIVMMSIRERKHEMGVLLSLGEKKWKLIGQFIVEIFIVAVVALGISSIGGNVVAGQIGNQLLENQLQVEESTNASTGGNFLAMGGSRMLSQQDADPIDELNVEVTAEDFGMLALIGIGIAILATLIPALSILQLQPKTILTKQE